MNLRIINPNFIPGFYYGFKYPVLKFSLSYNNEIILNCNELILENLENLCKVFMIDVNKISDMNLVSLITDLVHELLNIIQVPIYQNAKINDSKSIVNCLDVYIPTIAGTHKILLDLIVELFHISNIDFSKNIININKLLRSYQKHLYLGSNVNRFIKASADNNIPFFELTKDILQFGQCSFSIRMESSITQFTSHMGTKLARNKLKSLDILRQIGLPVPDNFYIYNYANALKNVKVLKYPVVVKPVDLDGGKGVFSNIRNDEQLINSIKKTYKYSKKLMLEKHIEGNDYRLTIFRGKMIWAVHRKPAFVIGDGINSIEKLVEITNNDERRSQEMNSALKKIIIDDESINLLKLYGYNKNDVPKKYEEVRLKNKANISSGGVPIAVSQDVHPDNEKLAIRASEALNLDFSGVDLLINDISKSWKDIGGAICEVNAQPQLGGITGNHLYGDVLNELVKNHGRIPIVVFYGLEKGIEFKLREKMKLDFNNIGIISSDEIFINDESILSNKKNLFGMSKILIMDQNIDLLILRIDDVKYLDKGLSFDQFNHLVVDFNFLKNDVDNKRKYHYKNLYNICNKEIFAFNTKDNTNKRIINSDSNLIINQLHELISSI